ncbi:MAG: CPBP family intramembrane glutamic endopeptidase [Gemmatimonadota bacterium]
MAEAVERLRAAGFWRRFGALFCLGMVGVLALVPVALTAGRRQLESMPDLEMPLGIFVLLTLLNPILLLAISVAAGVWLAPRLGLRSYVDEKVSFGKPVLPRLREDLRLAILLGAIGGTAVVLIDLAIAPWLSGGLAQIEQAQGRTLASTVAGLLYGGITEELMIRWGIMSFLAWAVWRLVGRGRGGPGAGAMWGAIVGAAIAFGMGHLPALAAVVPLTTPLIVRTVALNALGGVIFGWLYWRRSLEAAMVAHATFHVVFSIFALFA